MLHEADGISNFTEDDIIDGRSFHWRDFTAGVRSIS